MDAIAHGENMEPLLARLKSEECRKKELIAELDSLTQPARVTELNTVRLKRDLHARVADAKSLLHQTQKNQEHVLQQKHKESE